MKEIFDSFEKIGEDEKNLVLVDTCFLLDMLEKQKDHHMKALDFSMTSFNIKELLHVLHHIDHNLKHHVRQFFSQKHIKILEVPAEPGDWKKQREYVESVDHDIMEHIHDPSDAVLLAAAIKTGSVILTRDKHHVFTTDLKNFVRKYNITIYNKLRKAY